MRSLTLANIKTIRESIVEKKNASWMMFTAVVILLLLLFFQWYHFIKLDETKTELLNSKNAQLDALIAKSRDDSSTIQYFFGTNKELVATNKAIATQNRRSMRRIVNWDSIAKEFRVPSKDLTQVLRERNKTEVVIPQDSAAKIIYDNPFVVPIDTVNIPKFNLLYINEYPIRALEYTFRNPWFIGEARIGTTKKDTGYLKLQAWDTLTAIETVDKQGIHIAVSHANPYIKTVGLNKYTIKANTNPRPFNVSLSLGYGVVPTMPTGKILHPFAGITVGKTIFSFGKRKP